MPKKHIAEFVPNTFGQDCSLSNHDGNAEDNVD